MSQAAMVTGATGFLGSHLVAHLLKQFDDMPVICLSRSKSGRVARERVADGVRNAFRDQGLTETPLHWPERLIVAEDDLVSRGPVVNSDLLQISRGHQVSEFWHCAASVEFTGTYGGKVWQTNVGGVQNALEVARLIGASSFNHVSTAYVAGKRGGRIMETRHTHINDYNNIYEESKHFAEELVVHFCRSNRIGYRIFRPSIIVGHSRTYRTSSGTGFYQVVDLVKDFHDGIMSRKPGFFDHHALKIRVSREGTINLIPVDIAVSEMIDLCTLGARTLGQVFHITSESPLSVCDAFQTLLRLVGIKTFEIVGSEEKFTLVDRKFNRALNGFAPYLNNRKIFDRSNVATHDVDHHQVDFVMDVNRLNRFIQHYFDSKEDAPAFLGEFVKLAVALPNSSEGDIT